MEKALFTIVCTTCRRRLAVRSTEVIGAILDCPKCGSFVEIVPPEGWKPEQPASNPSQEPKGELRPPQVEKPVADRRGVESKGDGLKPRGPQSVPVPHPQLADTVVDIPPIEPPPIAAPPVSAPLSGKTAAAGRNLSPGDSGRLKKIPMVVAVAPTIAATPVANGAGPAAPPSVAPAFTPEYPAAEPPPPAWLPTWVIAPPFWAKWLMLAAAPAVGMGIMMVVWAVFFSSERPSTPPAATVEQTSDPDEIEPAPPVEQKPREKIAPTRFDRRWLPDDTRLVVNLRASRLAAQPQGDRVLARADWIWQKSGGALLRGLGLPMAKVHRMTWASTDLAAWAQRSVVVIELEQGQSSDTLAAAGEAVDIGIANLTCRRLSGDTWPYPVVVLDERTIVTGDEELLRGLAQRSEPQLRSQPIERLLKVIAPEGDITLLVDLAAARKARWQLPAALLDVWPTGKRPWRNLWEIPEGLACNMQWSGAVRSEFALVCEGESAAERVRAAMDELLPAVRTSLPLQMESLHSGLQSGHLNAATADQYRLLVDEAVTAIQAARWKAAEGIVWVHMNWGQGPLAAAEAALDSYPFLRRQWLLAALQVDAANQLRIWTGVNGHTKAEGALPTGAGGALLPPETRLSWITAMLPYLDHPDWYRNLDFAYKWNGPENSRITRTPLPEVVNPVLGPGMTDAGFPVTHYVGVAGLGPDAGNLPADHPRAGVFGYGRKTRLEDITDGASNTVAMLGVSGQCGPWAQGGNATIRPLSQRPYINGPDGFGSGQTNGMLATFADGSVRFLAANTDFRIIESMVTIHGGEPVDPSVFELKPMRRADGPEAKPRTAKPVPPVPKEKPAVKPKPPAQPDPRLALDVMGLEFSGQPLREVVETIAAVANLTVTFDLDAMQELSVSLRDPVTVKLEQTKLGDALEKVVSGRRLTCVMDNGYLLITSRPEHRDDLRPLRHNISDLTGNDPQALATLAAMVEKLVVPDSWQANGGRGTIEAKDGELLILQTGSVHYQIIVFYERLRVARGKSAATKIGATWSDRATRVERAKKILTHSVTAHHSDTRLVEILDYLGRSVGADILIDWPALAAAGIPSDVKGTVNTDKGRLNIALDELLVPLHLAWRAVDSKTLQVTTKKALDARMELEIYQVEDLLAKEEPAALMGRVKARLPAAVWSEAGGAGVLHFDAASQSLIVLQSQPMHLALQRALTEKDK